METQEMLSAVETEVRLLQGKTYSLHSTTLTSDDWYKKIAELADRLLRDVHNERTLLNTVRRMSRKKRELKSLLRRKRPTSLQAIIVQTLQPALATYTRNTASHLKSLTLTQRFDSALATSEEQYHLHMLEIELVNRLCVEDFRKSQNRLAFLPHCLRDLTADCQAVHHDIDYVCKACSDQCTVNAVSKLLRKHRVKPFIWMNADLRALLRKVKSEGGKLSVLGIACIPELVRGMRMCMRYHVPVVGIPLDANRCARWWGEFYWNTVNLRALERLLKVA